MQRSFDGTVLMFPCNDVDQGVAYPTNITSRAIGILRADGTISTSQRLTTAFRNSTSATLFRTVRRAVLFVFFPANE